MVKVSSRTINRHEPHHSTQTQVQSKQNPHFTAIKGKGKVHPRTCNEGPEGEERYSITLSLTSALDGGGWSTPRHGHFTPEKYPLYRGLGGPLSRSQLVRNISPPPRFDPRTVQPIASRYTDWAITTHPQSCCSDKICGVRITLKMYINCLCSRIETIIVS